MPEGRRSPTTRITYDEQTFRLIELVTTRASDNKKLQDLSYTYDPVGNITEIVDAAHEEVSFDGDEVQPKMAHVYDALYRPCAGRTDSLRWCE